MYCSIYYFYINIIVCTHNKNKKVSIVSKRNVFSWPSEIMLSHLPRTRTKNSLTSSEEFHFCLKATMTNIHPLTPQRKRFSITTPIKMRGHDPERFQSETNINNTGTLSCNILQITAVHPRKLELLLRNWILHISVLISSIIKAAEYSWSSKETKNSTSLI